MAVPPGYSGVFHSVKRLVLSNKLHCENHWLKLLMSMLLGLA